jgi:hypothetical protein
MTGERGYSIAELMVAIAVSMIILTAIMAMVQVSTRGQERVASRVAANQRARPVMTNIVNTLHSGCVAPGVAPVLAGSSDSSLSFISKSGDSVTPSPDRHVVSLSGTTLSESIYPATGGTPPTWTFSGTASSTRQLLTGVGPGAIGEPPSNVPLFRYYAYDSGEVSPTPLPTPLSSADAARTVRVEVAFASSPSGAPASDPNAPITLADSATLRLEPASEDTSEVNLPCV